MLSLQNIFDTIDMIDKQHLDIRTITMGISLRDCVCDSQERMIRKIKDKISRKAEHLVETGDRIGEEYGIPIVNKRISVTPVSLVTEAIADSVTDFTPFAVALDEVAKDMGVDFIGGFTALVHKGMTMGERNFIRSIPSALAQTDLVCSSVNVGSTKAGINMDAVARI